MTTTGSTLIAIAAFLWAIATWWIVRRLRIQGAQLGELRQMGRILASIPEGAPMSSLREIIVKSTPRAGAIQIPPAFTAHDDFQEAFGRQLLTLPAEVIAAADGKAFSAEELHWLDRWLNRHENAHNAFSIYPGGLAARGTWRIYETDKRMELPGPDAKYDTSLPETDRRTPHETQS